MNKVQSRSSGQGRYGGRLQKKSRVAEFRPQQND
jgi:hypothetical protein